MKRKRKVVDQSRRPVWPLAYVVAHVSSEDGNGALGRGEFGTL